MAIITKQVNGHKYLYEVISWRENGKVKQKWISLGRINDDAVIVKKKSEERPEESSVGIESEDRND